MPGEHNAGHGKLTDKGSDAEEVETRELGMRNKEVGLAAGMEGEEPRDVHKAGGGTVGDSQGGAHTGRYEGSPAKAVSNRQRKPRGEDKE